MSSYPPGSIDINRYGLRSGRIIKDDGSVVNEADGFNDDGSRNVRVVGGSLAESKTQEDAVENVIIFSKPIYTLEIYNTDSTNDGVFTVNGIAVTVPKNTPFKSAFAGIPSASVTVVGSTSYILNRYE